MIRFQLIRHCVSSYDSSLSDESFLTLSNHLRFGLSLLLFHHTSITITLLPTHSSYLLDTLLIHFKLLSCTFFGYISHLRYPYNYFIPYSVQLGNSAHPSKHPHSFLQHFVISSLLMYIGFARVLVPSYIFCTIIT